MLMEGEQKGEDQLKAVFFAAGTAAFMACIERVVVVSVFVHWRVWAFLMLNLLLIAILFTSKSHKTTRPNKIDREDDISSSHNNSSLELKLEKLKQDCIPMVPTNSTGHMENQTKNREEGEDFSNMENEMKIGEEEEEDQQISKEELHQRVEAFIAMFRQHLVSDAKNYGIEYRKKCAPMRSSQAYSPGRLSFSHSSEYILT